MLSLILVLLLQSSSGSGGTLPATCTTGDAFYVQSIQAPSGWYNCTAPNVWTSRFAGNPTYVVLTAARTNATTSYADITDLVIPVAANQRLDIECRFVYSANATTTGLGISWTGPGSPTATGGLMTAGLTSATVGGTTIVGNDSGGVTTASVGTTGNSATFHGTWVNGANAGNIQMRFRSEVAIANAIVIQPFVSRCKYQAF